MFIIDRPLLAPAVCFICEASPDGKWVDCVRDWEPNGFTHLNGRKYLCEGCITQAGKAIGLVEPEVYEAACENKDAALNRADDLAIRLASFEDFAKAVEIVKELFPNYVGSLKDKPNVKGRPKKTSTE